MVTSPPTIFLIITLVIAKLLLCKIIFNLKTFAKIPQKVKDFSIAGSIIWNEENLFHEQIEDGRLLNPQLLLCPFPHAFFQKL